MTELKTAEQVANDTDHLQGLANIRAINKQYRAQDDSHLWPILGKFNATNRAIRKARDFRRLYGTILGLEYCYLLEGIMSEIVNDPNL